jgi:broad specificity phosphatase PhoE
MQIILVRHGQSEAAAGLSSEIDCALTERGAAEAGAVAAALAGTGVACILSSPFRRCLQTAEVIRRVTAAPAELCPALHEHHHDPYPAGPWPLLSKSQLAAAFPDFAAPSDMPETRWTAVPEDRERLWKRISSVVRQVLSRFEGQADARVVVVTHGAPASVFVQAFCLWTNPLRASVRIDPGSISILEVDADGRRVLVQLNSRPCPIT